MAEIQPRTATPTQSSAMALSVINANSADSSFSFDRNKDGEKNDPYRQSSSVYERNASESLKRLSITGRLSQAPTTPASQLAAKQEGSIRDRFSFHKTPTTTREPSHSPANVTSSTSEYKFEANNGHSSSKAEQYKLDAEKADPSKYEARFESRFLAESHKTSDYKYEPSRAVEAKPEGIKTVAKSQSLEAQPVSGHIALNEMIRSCVDNSMASFTQEIKDAIQNFHIDAIKQNLAQQVAFDIGVSLFYLDSAQANRFLSSRSLQQAGRGLSKSSGGE